jgi:chromosomal replication initiation ATPase DnaA
MLCQRCHVEITIEQLRRNGPEVFRGHLPELLPAIMREVTAEFKVTELDLLLPNRTSHFGEARHVAFYLLRHVAGAALQTIGYCMARHHATVLHSCKVVTGRMAAQPGYAALIRKLERQVRRTAEGMVEGTETPVGRVLETKAG